MPGGGGRLKDMSVVNDESDDKTHTRPPPFATARGSFFLESISVWPATLVDYAVYYSIAYYGAKPLASIPLAIAN
jgi:hypothetical protein